jgi:hypothetical protein
MGEQQRNYWNYVFQSLKEYSDEWGSLTHNKEKLERLRYIYVSHRERWYQMWKN